MTAPLRGAPWARLCTGIVLTPGADVFVEAVPLTCGVNQNHHNPVPSRAQGAPRNRAVARTYPMNIQLMTLKVLQNGAHGGLRDAPA